MKLRTLIASFTALAGVTAAQAADYYWIGGSTGNWADGANWSLTEGGAAAGAYPNSENDSAFFSVDAEVALRSATYVRNVTIDANVTLKDGKVQTKSANNTAPLTVKGSGKLILSNAELIAPYATSAAGAQSTISCALDVAEGTVNTLTLATGISRYSSWTISGALSGAGTLIVRGGNDTNNYIAYLSCDASAFTGNLFDSREGDTAHARIRFMTTNSLSPQATYTLATVNVGGNNYALYAGGGDEVVYRMGALNGEVYFDGNNNAKSGQYFGYHLEIGAKNENCAFSGTLARPGYVSYTKKVGTGDLTFSGSQIPDLEIAEGTYIIGAASAVPTKMRFTGGAFSVAEGVSAEPVWSFASDTTAPVVYDDRGLDVTWASTFNDERLPMGFTKKGSGTLTLTTTPVHTTRTTIAEGALVVPRDTVVACLALEEGAKLSVPYTGHENETPVLTIASLADGTTVEMLAAALASSTATITLEETAEGYVVKATRAPLVFTWAGLVDTDWANAGNWMVNGQAAGEVPSAIDSVVIPSEGAPWTISASGCQVAELVAEGDTTFIIDDEQPLRTPMVRGAGTITLQTTGFFAPVNAASMMCVVSNDLVFAEGYVGTIRLNGASEQRVALHGDVSGQGAITVQEGGQRNGGVLVYGDWQNFSGSFAVESTNQYRRDYTRFFGVKSVSLNANYTIYGNDAGDLLESLLGDSKSDWRMGSLSGRFYMTSSNAGGHTLTVGNATDFECGGNIGHTSGSGSWYKNFIRKVGSGLFTSTITHVYGLYLAEGAVKLGSAEALPIDALTFEGGVLKAAEGVDPSTLIKNSAAPIAFDDEGTSATWATALASSNVGGLVKKGAGTLTLAAVPVYAGVTTVEAGELVVPAATRIHWDILSAGTLTGVLPTSYDYQVGTTNVYDSAAAVPTAGNHTLNLDNLLAIDLSSVTTVEKDSKFVIAEAKAFNVGDKAIGKSGRENIKLIWGKDTSFPEGMTAADYTLQVANGQLLVANKVVGFVLIFK